MPKCGFNKVALQLSNSLEITEFSNFLLQLKNQRTDSKHGWLFYQFYFERDHDILKPKSPYFLLNKNINLNKKETDWNMENSTKPVQESRIKSKTVMNWSSLKKMVFCKFATYFQNTIY